MDHISQISDKDADKYYNSRSYGARKIGAWASKQSKVLKNRSELRLIQLKILKKIS